MRAWQRLVAVLGGLALAASAVGCDWPEGTRFVHVVFDEADVSSGVLYRSTTDYKGAPADLRMDIFQPRGDTRAERPVVVWMFGGQWVFGDRAQLAWYARDSARRGYVGVTIDYRIRFLDPNDTLGAARDAYHDAVAAVEWLREHAAEYRIDPDAIVAGGVSAGAINAMNLAYVHDWGPPTSPVAGAVSISGLAFAGPRAGDPPAIMHHGTADDPAYFRAAEEMCSRARDLGNVCDWLPYEGGDHYIVASHAQQIADTTADRIFEHVLWPQGYREERMAPAG